MIWLVVDGNFIAHRTFHACAGYFQFDTMGVDLLCGILRDVNHLREELGCTDVVWCWDGGRLLRDDIYPDYKANRKEHPEETLLQKQVREKFRTEMGRCANKYLRNLGFANVFTAPGYEGDDIIASVCMHSLPPEDEAIIACSDQDMWQLLIQDRVSCWNPITGRYTTEASFMKEWRIPPSSWPEVKAIAGCQSDNVRGVRGVGEVTAAKYLRAELKHDSKAALAIDAAVFTTTALNRKLVTLPYPGCPMYELGMDELIIDRWNYVMDKLGATNRPRCPYPTVQPGGLLHGKR